MPVEEFLKTIKMSAFQASLIAILSIMSLYAIYRTETFVTKVHKVMATLDHSMIQTERAMVHIDRAEAITQALIDRNAQPAPVADKDAARPKAKPAPHIKVAATAPTPDKPAQPPAPTRN